LMDGVEIARSKIDEVINYILRKKIFNDDGDERDDPRTSN